VNRNISNGGSVANDDVAYPAQTQKCVRATDIVDNAEDRFGIERYDKIKIMMLRIGEGCAS
jgi:hypothetical protein